MSWVIASKKSMQVMTNEGAAYRLPKFMLQPLKCNDRLVSLGLKIKLHHPLAVCTSVFELNGVQHEEMSTPATSIALQTHSGTSPSGNYKNAN